MIDLSTVPTDAPAGTYMAIIGDLTRRSDAYAAQLREQIIARDDQITALRRDLAVARNDRLDARVRAVFKRRQDAHREAVLFHAKVGAAVFVGLPVGLAIMAWLWRLGIWSIAG